MELDQFLQLSGQDFTPQPHGFTLAGPKIYHKCKRRHPPNLTFNESYSRLVGTFSCFHIVAYNVVTHLGYITEIWIYNIKTYRCFRILAMESCNITSASISDDFSTILYTTLTEQKQQQGISSPENYETILVDLRIPVKSPRFVLCTGKHYQTAAFISLPTVKEFSFFIFVENLLFAQYDYTPCPADKPLQFTQQRRGKKGNEYSEIFTPPVLIFAREDVHWFQMKDNNAFLIYSSGKGKSYGISCYNLRHEDVPTLILDCHLPDFFLPPVPFPRLPLFDSSSFFCAPYVPVNNPLLHLTLIRLTQSTFCLVQQHFFHPPSFTRSPHYQLAATYFKRKLDRIHRSVEEAFDQNNPLLTWVKEDHSQPSLQSSSAFPFELEASFLQDSSTFFEDALFFDLFRFSISKDSVNPITNTQKAQVFLPFISSDSSSMFATSSQPFQSLLADPVFLSEFLASRRCLITPMDELIVISRFDEEMFILDFSPHHPTPQTAIHLQPKRIHSAFFPTVGTLKLPQSPLSSPPRKHSPTKTDKEAQQPSPVAPKATSSLNFLSTPSSSPSHLPHTSDSQNSGMKIPMLSKLPSPLPVFSDNSASIAYPLQNFNPSPSFQFAPTTLSNALHLIPFYTPPHTVPLSDPYSLHMKAYSTSHLLRPSFLPLAKVVDPPQAVDVLPTSIPITHKQSHQPTPQKPEEVKKKSFFDRFRRNQNTKRHATNEKDLFTSYPITLNEVHSQLFPPSPSANIGTEITITNLTSGTRRKDTMKKEHDEKKRLKEEEEKRKTAEKSSTQEAIFPSVSVPLTPPLPPSSTISSAIAAPLSTSSKSQSHHTPLNKTRLDLSLTTPAIAITSADEAMRELPPFPPITSSTGAISNNFILYKHTLTQLQASFPSSSSSSSSFSSLEEEELNRAREEKRKWEKRIREERELRIREERRLNEKNERCRGQTVFLFDSKTGTILSATLDILALCSLFNPLNTPTLLSLVHISLHHFRSLRVLLSLLHRTFLLSPSLLTHAVFAEILSSLPSALFLNPTHRNSALPTPSQLPSFLPPFPDLLTFSSDPAVFLYQMQSSSQLLLPAPLALLIQRMTGKEGEQEGDDENRNGEDAYSSSLNSFFLRSHPNALPLLVDMASLQIAQKRKLLSSAIFSEHGNIKLFTHTYTEKTTEPSESEQDSEEKETNKIQPLFTNYSDPFISSFAFTPDALVSLSSPSSFLLNRRLRSYLLPFGLAPEQDTPSLSSTYRFSNPNASLDPIPFYNFSATHPGVFFTILSKAISSSALFVRRARLGQSRFGTEEEQTVEDDAVRRRRIGMECVRDWAASNKAEDGTDKNKTAHKDVIPPSLNPLATHILFLQHLHTNRKREIENQKMSSNDQTSEPISFSQYPSDFPEDRSTVSLGGFFPPAPVLRLKHSAFQGIPQQNVVRARSPSDSGSVDTPPPSPQSTQHTPSHSRSQSPSQSVPHPSSLTSPTLPLVPTGFMSTFHAVSPFPSNPTSPTPLLSVSQPVSHSESLSQSLPLFSPYTQNSQLSPTQHESPLHSSIPPHSVLQMSSTHPLSRATLSGSPVSTPQRILSSPNSMRHQPHGLNRHSVSVVEFQRREKENERLIVRDEFEVIENKEMEEDLKGSGLSQSIEGIITKWKTSGERRIKTETEKEEEEKEVWVEIEGFENGISSRKRRHHVTTFKQKKTTSSISSTTPNHSSPLKQSQTHSVPIRPFIPPITQTPFLVVSINRASTLPASSKFSPLSAQSVNMNDPATFNLPNQQTNTVQGKAKKDEGEPNLSLFSRLQRKGMDTSQGSGWQSFGTSSPIGSQSDSESESDYESSSDLEPTVESSLPQAMLSSSLSSAMGTTLINPNQLPSPLGITSQTDTEEEERRRKERQRKREMERARRNERRERRRRRGEESESEGETVDDMSVGTGSPPASKQVTRGLYMNDMDSFISGHERSSMSSNTQKSVAQQRAEEEGLLRLFSALRRFGDVEEEEREDREKRKTQLEEKRKAQVKDKEKKMAKQTTVFQTVSSVQTHLSSADITDTPVEKAQEPQDEIVTPKQNRNVDTEGEQMTDGDKGEGDKSGEIGRLSIFPDRTVQPSPASSFSLSSSNRWQRKTDIHHVERRKVKVSLDCFSSYPSFIEAFIQFQTESDELKAKQEEHNTSQIEAELGKIENKEQTDHTHTPIEVDRKTVDRSSDSVNLDDSTTSSSFLPHALATRALHLSLRCLICAESISISPNTPLTSDLVAFLIRTAHTTSSLFFIQILRRGVLNVDPSALARAIPNTAHANQHEPILFRALTQLSTQSPPLRSVPICLNPPLPAQSPLRCPIPSSFTFNTIQFSPPASAFSSPLRSSPNMSHSLHHSPYVTTNQSSVPYPTFSPHISPRLSSPLSLHSMTLNEEEKPTEFVLSMHPNSFFESYMLDPSRG
ncbi:hypothetical protein BLNAU_17859 [Blattamonas nauphoetae]|uniref:Uncharacterized protein n=1 Tax=Blattamonas nauphoetae TaxID=2049346 RepID=A0ABQ9X635_9EUKA|nr:hypothetical protein BLNAU_17859 [Blattamonas nauphoetae]